MEWEGEYTRILSKNITFAISKTNYEKGTTAINIFIDNLFL